jgi:hypothetical protein
VLKVKLSKEVLITDNYIFIRPNDSLMIKGITLIEDNGKNQEAIDSVERELFELDSDSLLFAVDNRNISEAKISIFERNSYLNLKFSKRCKITLISQTNYDTEFLTQNVKKLEDYFTFSETQNYMHEVSLEFALSPQIVKEVDSEVIKTLLKPSQSKA